MVERKVFSDIPGGKNSFHSAVLTSFSFNFHHFENDVLRLLKQRWISSINILVDQHILDDILGISSGNLKTVSQTYSVNGISSKGAFHPKINFFLGDTKALVLFGSGNITPGGHGKNHEIFSGFYVDDPDSPQLPLILETWSYITSQTKQVNGYSAHRINQVLPSSCSLLKEFEGRRHQLYKLTEQVEVALLYNEDTSILEQLRKLLGEEKVKKITIVSPYFDQNGSTILLLKEIFENPDIDVYLQPESGLPPSEISASEKVNFYNWDYTIRGKKKIGGRISYQRKLHGKVFHFKTNSAEYCLLGSPNATRHALGNLSMGPSNEEFGALYKSVKLDFLKELGVTGKKSIVNVNSLQRPKLILGDEPPKNTHLKIRINSVDLESASLKVFLNKRFEEKNHLLKLYDTIGEEIFNIPIENISSLTLEFKINQKELKSSLLYCLIADENSEPVSNKQLINFVTRLKNTNPSESNRTIRELINSIEGGVFNEFEIIEYLNEIHSHKNGTLETRQTHSLRPKTETEKEKEVSTLTYEEAIKAAKIAEDSLDIINNYSTSRIWNSLQHLFDINKEAIAQDLMDEEEEGGENEKKPGNPVDLSHPPIIIKSEKNAMDKFRSLGKMALNYIESIQRLRSKKDFALTIIDYYQFLLVTTLLTNICYFTEYEVRSDKFKESDLKDELNLLYRDIMLNILMEFLAFCQENKQQLYDQKETDLKEKQETCLRLVKRRIFLYLGLIERRTREEIVLDKIRLLGLNFLESLGPVDSEFETFVQDTSQYYKNSYFSSQRVIKLKNQIVALLENNPQFILTKYNGYGKVLDRIKNKIRVKTLSDVIFLSESEVAK